jgi:DNA-binding transcriptional LysR family regulator
VPQRPQPRLSCLAEPKAELLSLQQVRCFCAAAELGSFTAAAEALAVSQPAVAEQVRRLERLLGAPLFVRAGRGVTLTDAGQAFAEHAFRTLAALEDAAASVGALTGLRQGVVTLGTFNWPAAWELDRVVASFLRRHPGMTVRLVGRNSSVTAEAVRRGELEAAVVVLPVDDRMLDVRPIVRDEVLYVSADRRRTAGPATIDRLASVPLVFYDADAAENDPIRRQLAERAQADGLELRPRVEVEHLDLALRLVAEGVGDTYLPSAYTWTTTFPAGLFSTSFRPALHDTFAVITRRAAHLSPATRQLLSELEDHIAAVAADLDRSRYAPVAQVPQKVR